MKIFRSVYDRLVNLTAPVPPETGGILGGKEDTIAFYQSDTGNPDAKYPDIYFPNTAFLNRCIAQWQTRGISLLGIYHSHSINADCLSNGDKEYIRTIMYSLPPSIRSLYFPLVFPKNHIKAYRADISDHQLIIACEQIEII